MMVWITQLITQYEVWPIGHTTTAHCIEVYSNGFKKIKSLPCRETISIPVAVSDPWENGNHEFPFLNKTSTV